MKEIPFIEINNLLVKWASNTPLITDFTVENIIASLKLEFISYDRVLEFLMRKDGLELRAQKTLICPSCNYKIESCDLEQVIDDEIIFDCQNCGENEIYFDAENMILTFIFTEAFILQSKKKR